MDLKYLVCAQDRPVACLAWSSAPRHLAPRDRFIGWSPEARRRHLHLIAYNTRFLLLPKIPTYSYTSPVLGCKSNSGCFSVGGGTARPEWTFAIAA